MNAFLLLSVLAAAAGAGPAGAGAPPPPAPAPGGIGVGQGLLMGLVQGLTEFLPVSSSGHLALGRLLWGGGGAAHHLAFDVAVHAATLFAMALYFRDEIVELFTRRPRVLGMILLASAPAALAGLTLEQAFKSLGARPAALGALFLLNGLILLASRRFGVETKRMSTLTAPDALLVGLAQAVALAPGISRSGATISAGLFSGLRREEAFTFSFLLGMPAIAGATLLKMRGIRQLAVSESWSGLVAGFAAAFFAGLVAVGILGRLVRRRNLSAFGAYTAVLGAVVIILGLVGVLRGS